jgi:tetratricopeptide (TPR) repeat protein
VSAVLSRLWRPTPSRRPETAADLFGQADRLRRTGRYGDAAQLVSRGLRLDPASITGHLLAAYLHAARRTVEPARQEFQRVLERDPAHPRALLGLARLALEAGDLDGCREALVRALRAYPDFPEARALLDGLATRPPVATLTPPRLDRLRVPAAALTVLALGGDGAVLAAQPETAADGAPHLARTIGLAVAALQRAGLGPLRRGVVENAAARHFFRGDGTLTLVVALPRTTHITQGLLEVNRLWAAAQHELAVASDEAAAATVPASARRVS